MGSVSQESEMGRVLGILSGDVKTLIGICGEEADILSCISAYYIYVDPTEASEGSRQFASVLQQKL